MKIRLGIFWAVLTAVFLICVFGSLAVAGSVMPIGQIVSGGAIIDGILIPSGGTLLSSSSVKTFEDPAVIHLTNGQMVKVARNSEAFFEFVEEDTIKATVMAGTIVYRAKNGLAIGVPPAATLVATRNSISSSAELTGGVVAVVSEVVKAGAKVVRVNDTTLINPSEAVLVKKDQGDEGNLYTLKRVSVSEVEVAEPVTEGLPKGAMLFQGDRLKKVLASGAAIGTSSFAIPWKLVTVGASVPGVVGVVSSVTGSSEGVEVASQSSPNQ